MQFDRRRFLLLAGGATAWYVIRPYAALAKKAAAGGVLQPWSLSPDPPGDPVDLARALIGAAVLAPSDWNSQPWRFEVEGSTIRVVSDARRALIVTDPDRRGMMLSLGAALENLLIAARAYGLRPTVTYLPHEGANGVVAEVMWTNGDARRDRAMFEMIPERRTNRREFDGRGLYPQNRAQLGAQVPEGLALHWIDDRRKIRGFADLVFDATRAQGRDPRVEAEHYAWIRFGDDARRRGDGIPVEALEFGGPAEWFAGRYFNPNSMFSGFGADSAAKQSREQVRSAGALALLTASRRDDTQRLMAGQAIQRFALKATEVGIAHQILSAPIEAPSARGPLLAAFGATGEDPLVLMRLGHARAPKPAVRRGVSLVATFRNT